MSNGFGYVWEKMMSAVWSLAASNRDIRERLLSAFISFHTLNEGDFPEGDLREQWRSIQERMTFHEEPAPGGEGSVKYTLSLIDDDACELIAKDIYELFLAVCSEKEDREVAKRVAEVRRG